MKYLMFINFSKGGEEAGAMKKMNASKKVSCVYDLIFEEGYLAPH